jgi:hypothetical protein
VRIRQWISRPIAPESPRRTSSGLNPRQERALLEEFVTKLQPSILGQLVRVVFDRMQLAGEAGSLLRIGADIADAVAEVKKQWLTRPPKAEQ